MPEQVYEVKAMTKCTVCGITEDKVPEGIGRSFDVDVCYDCYESGKLKEWLKKEGEK